MPDTINHPPDPHAALTMQIGDEFVRLDPRQFAATQLECIAHELQTVTIRLEMVRRALKDANNANRNAD